MSSRKSENFTLNSNDLELRVKLIEKSLEPFINQMLMPNPHYSAQIKKGHSRNIQNLVTFLNDSINNFIKHSNHICNEYPSLKIELSKEINNLKAKGDEAIKESGLFANDPLSSSRRKEMANGQKNLLHAVARLLAIADMIDEYSIVKIIDRIQIVVNSMKKTTNEDEFLKHYKSYAENLKDLLNLTASKHEVNTLVLLFAVSKILAGSELCIKKSCPLQSMTRMFLIDELIFSDRCSYWENRLRMTEI